MFLSPQTDQEKNARHQITKQIGRAAHILDVTRRGGRSHGSRIGRGTERVARRDVAAYVAKAEEMLWDKGAAVQLQATVILQVAAYETVLRKWALHTFNDVDAPQPIPVWQRRVKPFLKGTVALGATIAPLAWQVFGAEDQVPGHLIRVYLQSRGLLGQ
jgi:hypothetical protein